MVVNLVLVCVAGEEVNWVQCDRCELWFHLVCVGLGEDEVSENEDYVCYQCKKPAGGAVSAPQQLKPPGQQPRKMSVPRPKKPVDEAITKGYKDFLDELDMDQIGASKLRSLERTLSDQGVVGGQQAMEGAYEEEEELEEEDYEGEEEEADYEEEEEEDIGGQQTEQVQVHSNDAVIIL